MSKTHVIDGKTYVEVERPAKVGEKVIDLKEDVGQIRYCINADRWDGTENAGEGISVDETFYQSEYWGNGYGLDHGTYRVLEAVDQAPESIVDIIANLIRRVASLESQLRDTQANVERQGVEISANEHAIDELSHRMNHVEADVELNEEDIRKIGAGVQAPQSGATLLADAFEALAKYERSVGR